MYKVSVYHPDRSAGGYTSLYCTFVYHNYFTLIGYMGKKRLLSLDAQGLRYTAGDPGACWLLLRSRDDIDADLPAYIYLRGTYAALHHDGRVLRAA